MSGVTPSLAELEARVDRVLIWTREGREDARAALSLLVARAREMEEAAGSFAEQFVTATADPLDLWLCIDGNYVRPATNQEAEFLAALSGAGREKPAC